MKRLLLFLILLLGHAARSKGQTFGPPQDGMRHTGAAAFRPRQYDRQNTPQPQRSCCRCNTFRQNTPQPSLPQQPPDKQPAAATRPKTAYANRR